MTHQDPIIAITGVTGKIGGAVAAELQDRASQLRLLVRDAKRAPQLKGQIAVTHYADADATRKALAGVDVLFMVSAGESPERVRQHQVFVDSAAAAGVQHIVYTSFLGAGPDATFTLARDHWHTEQHIRTSGMSWTFLRDSFYMDFFPDVVDESDEIRGPAGDGRVGAVARRDVARSAIAVLRDPSRHAGVTYDLTDRRRSHWLRSPRSSVRPGDGGSPTGGRPWRRPMPQEPAMGLPIGRSMPGSPPTPRSPPVRWMWSLTASGS